LVWAAPSLSRNLGLAPDRTGNIMAGALVIAGIAGPVLGGALADVCQRHGGPHRTMLALCILTALGIPPAMFALMPNETLAATGLTLLLMIGFVASVAAFALSSIVIPAELRAVYVGVSFSAAAVVGLGGAPLAVSALSGLLGGPSAIGVALTIICVVTSVLAAVSFAVSRKRYLASYPARSVTR
jgi:MFS family permease